MCVHRTSALGPSHPDVPASPGGGPGTSETLGLRGGWASGEPRTSFVSDRLSNVEGSSSLQHLDLTNACATLKVVSKDGRNEGGSCLTFKSYHKGKNLPPFFPPLCL